MSQPMKKWIVAAIVFAAVGIVLVFIRLFEPDREVENFRSMRRLFELCARKTPVHAERGYPDARNRLLHHSLPIIPGSARDRKPRSFFLCFAPLLTIPLGRTPAQGQVSTIWISRR